MHSLPWLLREKTRGTWRLSCIHPRLWIVRRSINSEQCFMIEFESNCWKSIDSKVLSQFYFYVKKFRRLFSSDGGEAGNRKARCTIPIQRWEHLNLMDREPPFTPFWLKCEVFFRFFSSPPEEEKFPISPRDAIIARANEKCRASARKSVCLIIYDGLRTWERCFLLINRENVPPRRALCRWKISRHLRFPQIFRRLMFADDGTQRTDPNREKEPAISEKLIQFKCSYFVYRRKISRSSGRSSLEEMSRKKIDSRACSQQRKANSQPVSETESGTRVTWTKYRCWINILHNFPRVWETIVVASSRAAR